MALSLYGNPEFPQREWNFVEMRLSDTEHECQACGREDVKLSFVIAHPAWPERIRCGTQCAHNLVLESQRAALLAQKEFAERKLRRDKTRERRLNQWLHRGWRRTEAGNNLYRARGQVLIYWDRDVNLWAVQIGGRWSDRRYADYSEAMVRAFNWLDEQGAA